MNCRSSRQRPAPSAVRTANSLCRDSARASSRLARFAQAMSSTNTTAPCRTKTAVRALPTICICSGSSRRRWFFGVRRVRTAGRRRRARDRRGPAGEQRVELGLRTLQRRTVGEPADQIEIVAAAVLPVRGIEHQRIPDFDVLVGDVEMRRHDADDGAANAVDLDLRVRSWPACRRTPTATARRTGW